MPVLCQQRHNFVIPNGAVWRRLSMARAAAELPVPGCTGTCIACVRCRCHFLPLLGCLQMPASTICQGHSCLPTSPQSVFSGPQKGPKLRLLPIKFLHCYCFQAIWAGPWLPLPVGLLGVIQLRELFNRVTWAARRVWEAVGLHARRGAWLCRLPCAPMRCMLPLSVFHLLLCRTPCVVMRLLLRATF